MHFCEKCGNMYYIKLFKGDENQLIYYCRKCGNENTMISENNVIVSKTTLKKKKQTFDHIVNKYTKLDPTLPRIQNMKCPNKECVSNDEDSNIENEIIYIRYDNEDLKYIYLCANCDTCWRSDETH